MRAAIYYVLAIIIANLGFSYIPMIPIGFGEMFAPMSLLVGFVFVLRDYAQQELGHKVLIAMAVGAVASYILADPFVAVASVIAFGVSEVIDWAIYSVTKRPFKDRVLLSSVVSTPVDSAVFMLILGFFSWYGLAAMVISKMIGAVFIYYRPNFFQFGKTQQA